MFTSNTSASQPPKLLARVSSPTSTMVMVSGSILALLGLDWGPVLDLGLLRGGWDTYCHHFICVIIVIITRL